MRFYHLIIVSFFIALFSSNAFAIQQHSVIEDLENIISQGKSAASEKYEEIKIKIEREPDIILPILLSKATSPQLSESDLAIYIWAIGLTKSPKAIEEIIKLSTGRKSELVKSNVYRALASIGGEKAGEYLFEQLDQISDQTMRYNIIDLLAQIQYKPALPQTIEILRQNPSQLYWQTIFIFGKYGDIAIPFLLENIGAEDQNVRTNAIMALGQWLVPTEALIPFKNQFWQETSPQIRGLILSSLEKINTDLSDVHSFSQTVIKKETDENIKRFAQETINNFENMKQHIEDFKSKKREDSEAFNAEYNKILNTLGKRGDYQVLSVSSSQGDEQKLKKLRETILQRNSDECFYDYQKINNIIILNRLI